MASAIATTRAAIGCTPIHAVRSFKVSASTANAVPPETRKASACRTGCWPAGAIPLSLSSMLQSLRSHHASAGPPARRAARQMRLPHGDTPLPDRAGQIGRIADEGGLAGVAPAQNIQKDRADAGQHVHVLMPIDVVRWGAQLLFEPIELAFDLGADFAGREQA